MKAEFEELGNPFLAYDTKELYQLETKDVMSDDVACAVKNLILWARSNFRNFVTLDSLSEL